MAYALKALSARALSESELRLRLDRRAENPGDTAEVIGKLREAGYLNDQQFAASYAAARRDTQGFGKFRVLRDLRQRRVASDVAEGAVKETFEGIDEAGLAESFLKRKYRNVNLPEFLAVDRNLISAYRKLRLGGFSSGVAIRILKEYAAQADQLEAFEEESTGESDSPPVQSKE